MWESGKVGTNSRMRGRLGTPFVLTKDCPLSHFDDSMVVSHGVHKQERNITKRSQLDRHADGSGYHRDHSTEYSPWVKLCEVLLDRLTLAVLVGVVRVDGELFDGTSHNNRAAECGEGCGNSFRSRSEPFGASHLLTQPARSESSRGKPDTRSENFDGADDFRLVPLEWDGHYRNTVGRQSSFQRYLLEKKIACFFLAFLCFRRFTCPNKGTHKFAIHIPSFSLAECSQRSTCSTFSDIR